MRRGRLRRRLAMNRGWPAMLLLTAVVLTMSACGPKKEAAVPEPRPVRTVTAKPQDAGETVMLTGHIQAEDEASMAFRIGGRMIERFVNVGDRVKPGQELARLDPQNEVNALRSAQAGLTAAQAQLTQARSAFERQRTLLAQGHTPRAQFDLAEKALQTAQAQVDDGEVQVRIAADRVSFTVLQADAAGTITARGAEPGEVVQAGTDDRATGASGWTRRRVRRARAGAAIGAKRSAGHDTPDRRSQRDDDRTRARGRPAGRSGDPDLPGQSRPDRSAGGDATRLDGERFGGSGVGQGDRASRPPR